MNDDKHLTIHFNNGTKMEVAFPIQIKNSTAAVLESIKKALESDKLVIEAEGKLVIIPWYSITRLIFLAGYTLTGAVTIFAPKNIWIPAIVAIWALISIPQTVLSITFSVVMNHVAGEDGRFELMSRRWSLLSLVTAKAVCFHEALRPSFTDYSRQIVKNAKAMADTLIGHDLRLVSGGTDNHLILLDLTAQGITGLEAEIALGKAGITVNKNTIPNENRSPFVTSGLRIGTPAVTSRGMKEEQMHQIGDYIASILKDISNTAQIARIEKEVIAMAGKYPLYPE